MQSFTDSAGRPWTIRFDGLLLGALRDERGINLADVSGADYIRLESDAAVLTRAICFLCADQINAAGITDKQFASAFTGESQEAAIAAIWGAAKVFFRPKHLSALVSNCEQQKAAQKQWDEIRPMLSMLNQPDMPESLRLGIMEALKEQMQGTTITDLPALAGNPSVAGLAATLSKPASRSPDSAVSAPAA
jgi:hypothetical protein